MSSKNKTHITGNILLVLLLLALLNSANFFLSIAKFGVYDWLSFNSCSLAIIVYLICFACFKITKKDFYLAIALLPLYYYGTMGIFVIPWNEINIFAQITHILITLNVIWILYNLLSEFRYASLGKGLLIGVLVFVPVFAVIQSNLQLHMSEFMEAISIASYR